MFTGIIKAVALIKHAEVKDGSLFLTIARPKGWRMKPGDSISTDGACLTVRSVNKKQYTVELMPETLDKTYFGKQICLQVNLEQSLRVTDRLDGHIVLGHVDAVGVIKKIANDGRAKVYTIQFPARSAALVAPKGSITVDGVSLTVTRATKTTFSVSLVEYTLNHTALGQKQIGDLVNLEFDVLAKYLYRFKHAR
ncbi:MAG: riboflavin synthase [Candidatus Harrisonbacteria bacterium CG10_big_fil_rev_8_21_14_0_10_49_15]|uniref:Riboflavin synthase n=1 Tax=Candidatus Harrisonbacteria bacterium CG10_big_fil_rev_8_21_14_0_10_49_15 TaxID=1974587 RepID=A0A2H0UMG7_9BACT|nr:MAG: riboflavin synthase [Candidatus Harrisonbacteria bacterium CG10_big_fil_rev_8_21_14_0_10_49_15]